MSFNYFIKSGGRVLSTAPRYLLILLILVAPISNADTVPYLVGHDSEGNGCYPTGAQACENHPQQIILLNQGNLLCWDTPAGACNATNYRPAPDNRFCCGANPTGGSSSTCSFHTFIENNCNYCPDGYQDNGNGACDSIPTTCPTGQQLVNGVCIPENQCTPGASGTTTGPPVLPLGSATTIMGCSSTDCEQIWTPSVETLGYVLYNSVESGNTCSETTDGFNPNSPPPDLPEPLPTPLPQSGGCVQTGGQVTCSEDATNSPPVPDNGTPGTPAEPDAKQTDPNTGDTFNTFNNTTTNNSTNFSGNTPTGGTGSDGGSTGLGGIDQDGDGQGDCDPSIEDCGASNTGGGLTCDSPPTCEGDAIACAIRFQAWSTRCNLEDNTTDITESDVMGQLGQTQTIEEYFDTANNPENEIDVMSETTLPTPTSGTCPPDLDMTLSIGSLTFPSQPICDIATIVRPAILALAYLISGLMFYNGLVRDF